MDSYTSDDFNSNQLRIQSFDGKQVQKDQYNLDVSIIFISLNQLYLIKYEIDYWIKPESTLLN